MTLIEWPYYSPKYLLEQGFSENTPARFWSKVRVGPACWVWIGSRDENNYGRLNNCLEPRVPVHAQRVSWMLHYGPIPSRKFVLHRCDNPCCVRPDHLFIGDASVNMADCASKGRTGNHAGEASGRSKLTDNDVRYIRSLAGQATTVDLGVKFGVHSSQISRIINRKTWRHI